jgi:hypothetical protein
VAGNKGFAGPLSALRNHLFLQPDNPLKAAQFQSTGFFTLGTGY